MPILYSSIKCEYTSPDIHIYYIHICKVSHTNSAEYIMDMITLSIFTSAFCICNDFTSSSELKEITQSVFPKVDFMINKFYL